jgi:hypothetical protein
VGALAKPNLQNPRNPDPIIGRTDIAPRFGGFRGFCLGLAARTHQSPSLPIWQEWVSRVLEVSVPRPAEGQLSSPSQLLFGEWNTVTA